MEVNAMESSKKRVLVILTVLWVGGVLVIGAGTKSQTPEERPMGPVAKILSGSSQEIKKTQDQLVAERKDLISGLTGIVGEMKNRVTKPGSVRAAMFVVGEMRAVEAVEILVEHIGFPWVREPWPEPYPGPSLEGGNWWHRRPEDIGKVYPAAEALIKIGEPCLDAVTSKLAATGHVTEQKACLSVLSGLRDRDYVIYMLEKAIGKEKDPKKLENLQRGIEELTPKKKEAKEESADTKP